jgi:hypothetical protein
VTFKDRRGLSASELGKRGGSARAIRCAKDRAERSKVDDHLLTPAPLAPFLTGDKTSLPMSPPGRRTSCP